MIGHVLSFLFSTVLLIAAVVGGDLGAARAALARAGAMAYIVIAVCFGLAGGIVGKIKGSSFWLWFLISGLVPFFGLLAAIAYRFERDELRRQCPRCGRVTKIYDAICTRCGDRARVPRRGDRSPSPGSARPAPPRTDAERVAASREFGALSRIRPP